ncbi:MAG: TIGR03790 family protein [Kiritimatiellia bacterium]
MNSFERLFCILSLAAACLLPAVPAWAAGEPRTDVIVIANSNVPGSLEVARNYLAARNIPESNLCLLDLPAGEIISRDFYDQRLRDPLLEIMRAGKFIEQKERDPKEVKPHESKWITIKASIRYLVPVYGVPVKIADTKFPLAVKVSSALGKGYYRDTAAVDSELAMALAVGWSLEGPYNNALHDQFALIPSKEGTLPLLVARLDGPDVQTAKNMIDGALFAERYGLCGRMYFDSQETSDPGYYAGDHWIREAYERFSREGYECHLDRSMAVFQSDYPMSDAALYFGWYTEHVTGPFKRSGFKFAPGAIAYHIHSASAKMLRTRTRYWTGPLLAAGAAVSMGAVSEPYLTMSPNLDILSDRICGGSGFGDAAVFSLRALSWQFTIAGDPLYAPFRYPLEQQISHLQEDKRPEIEWAYVRKVNLMVRGGALNPALEFCREKIAETGSLVLKEKLGDLYVKNAIYSDAIEQYRAVLNETSDDSTAMRVGARLLTLLRLQGRTAGADELEAELKEKWKGSPLLTWLDSAGKP